MGDNFCIQILPKSLIHSSALTILYSRLLIRRTGIIRARGARLDPSNGWIARHYFSSLLITEGAHDDSLTKLLCLYPNVQEPVLYRYYCTLRNVVMLTWSSFVFELKRTKSNKRKFGH